MSTHKYTILCQYPDKVKICDKLPDPPLGCSWQYVGLNSNGLQKYHLVTPVVWVTFVTDEESIILPSYSIKDKSKLPKIPPRVGYTSFWPIPDGILASDMTIEPVYQIIQKHITFQYEDRWSRLSKIVCPFTIESPDVYPPSIDYIPPGFKSISWESYDTSILEDQISNAVYEPIIIKYHMPDGSIVERKSIELQQYPQPSLSDDVWPKIPLCNSDIDIYPEPKLHFALFYERNKRNFCLKFCVPFTRDDDHYVNDILTNNRPRKGASFVNWTLLDEDEDKRRYICDYSVSPDDRDDDFIDWSFENIPYNVDILRSITLSSRDYNLFKTDFKKYTGYDENNVDEYRSLKLRPWLDKYKIPYECNVLDWNIKENKDGPCVYISRGRFIVEYSETTREYIDYLQEFDILFEKYRIKSVRINGKEACHLRSYASLGYEDDPEKVFHDEIMHDNALIRPFSYPETEFTSIKIKSIAEREIENGPQRSLDERMQENQATINIVNSDFDTDLKYTILDDEAKTVEITGYSGAAYHYEIPAMIQIGPNGNNLYSVVKIGTAFYGSHMIRITIPDTVTEIGESAFAFSDSLHSVELSENLITIGPLAFKGCKKLTSLTLPASLKNVGKDALLPIRNLYCKCPPDVIPADSYRTCWCNFHIIEDEDSRDTIEKPSNDSPVDQFVRSLTIEESTFLLKLMDGYDDASEFSRSIGKSLNTIECEINKKVEKYLDDSEGIFDDEGLMPIDEFGELEFNSDYEVNLKDKLCINLTIHNNDNPKGVLKKTKSPLDQFFNSLTREERTFLLKLMDGYDDASEFSRSIGKSLNTIECEINKKVEKYLDDSEGIFDDEGLMPIDEFGELEFNTDYEVNLRDRL